MNRTWRIYRQVFLPPVPGAPPSWTWEPLKITGSQSLLATLAGELTYSTGLLHQIRSEETQR